MTSKMRRWLPPEMMQDRTEPEQINLAKIPDGTYMTLSLAQEAPQAYVLAASRTVLPLRRANRVARR